MPTSVIAVPSLTDMLRYSTIVYTLLRLRGKLLKTDMLF